MKNNNPLYSNIENSSMMLLVTDFTEDTPITLEEETSHENHNSETENSLEDQKEIRNPLQNYQQSASKSLVVNKNIHEIVPGEDFSTK